MWPFRVTIFVGFKVNDMITQSMHKTPTEVTGSNWLQRLAWAAPLFFLAKGILWLLLPVLLALQGL